MKNLAAPALALAALLLAPPAAQAQAEFLKDNVTKIVRKVGVHANVSVREPVDGDLTKGTTFGGAVVLGGGRNPGWKYPVALTSSNMNLHAPGGEQFARLKSRAIVGGIGYNWNFGKLTASAGVQTGYAFNSGTLEGHAARAFGDNGPVSLKIGNAFLLRPKLSLEYFLTQKFTLRTSADYVETHPTITVTTPSGAISDRWNASSFHATFGIGFYPFRK